jgi:hypothetical protein
MSEHRYPITRNITNFSTTCADFFTSYYVVDSANGSIVNWFDEKILSYHLGPHFREILAFWVWLDKNWEEIQSHLSAEFSANRETLTDAFDDFTNTSLGDFLFSEDCKLSDASKLATMELFMLDHGLEESEMYFLPLFGCAIHYLTEIISPRFSYLGKFKVFNQNSVNYINPRYVDSDAEIQVTLTYKQLLELYSLIPVVYEATGEAGVLGEIAKAPLHFMY